MQGQSLHNPWTDQSLTAEDVENIKKGLCTLDPVANLSGIYVGEWMPPYPCWAAQSTHHVTHQIQQSTVHTGTSNSSVHTRSQPVLHLFATTMIAPDAAG